MSQVGLCHEITNGCGITWDFHAVTRETRVPARADCCVDLSRRRDKLGFSHHSEVASLKPAAQEALLNLAEENKLSVRELRDEVRQFKRLETSGPTALPTGKYSLVYADPPWQYDFAETDNRQIENHYQTMPVAEICALPVGGVCDEDCVLLLWATSPKPCAACVQMSNGC